MLDTKSPYCVLANVYKLAFMGFMAYSSVKVDYLFELF